jgi:uncharacterized ubiquitin-like protein YukD
LDDTSDVAKRYKLDATDLKIIYNLTTEQKIDISLDEEQIQRQQKAIAQKLKIPNKATLIISKAFKERIIPLSSDPDTTE